jgi:hypothetical protein
MLDFIGTHFVALVLITGGVFTCALCYQSLAQALAPEQ